MSHMEAKFDGLSLTLRFASGQDGIAESWWEIAPKILTLDAPSCRTQLYSLGSLLEFYVPPQARKIWDGFYFQP